MRKEQIIIGTPVIYWSVIQEDGKRFFPKLSEVVSEVWQLGCGIDVCKIKGVSGGVSIDHLDTVSMGSLMAAKLQGLEDVTNEMLVETTKNYFNGNGVNVENISINL